MKNFLNKPWTWGTYLIVCAVSLLISGLGAVFTLRMLRR